MKLSRTHNKLLSGLLAVTVFLSCLAQYSFAIEYTPPTKATTAPASSDEELDDLQEQYDKLEQKIAKSEENLKIIESGKSEQKQNISALQSQITDLDSQIDVLETRIDVLDSDINRLNVSIGTLNTEIDKLTTQIDETQTLLYETQRSIDLVSDKVYSRLLMSYMSGEASYLELLVGAKDLYTLFTRYQIIKNISDYDEDLIDQLGAQLTRLDELNTTLDTDITELKEKKASLSGEQSTLFAKQSDIESSAYVLEMKKQLNQYKYGEAVAYFKTLDKSSADYNSMLKLFSDEQQKIDDQMNAYLLKYGSSADDVASGEAVTAASGDGDSISTTKAHTTAQFTTVAGIPQTIGSQFTTKPVTTTSANPDDFPDLTIPTSSSPVTAASINLMWPMPYKNCYISAYYGTYPSGGIHRGLDICVRGGTEGKNIVAAANGKVIRYGFNHWSMGNYIIIDHGAGLFTAYYHMSKLYVAQGDTVTQGQVIGLAGHTGNTTGPHLHFEVRISKNGSVQHTNPLNWVSMP